MERLTSKEKSDYFKKLDNSNGLIHSAGYFHKNNYLEIALFDGTIYQYFNVPYKTFIELLDADNPDEFYRQNIRNNYKRLFKRFSFWD